MSKTTYTIHENGKVFYQTLLVPGDHEGLETSHGQRFLPYWSLPNGLFGGQKFLGNLSDREAFFDVFLVEDWIVRFENGIILHF